MFLREDQPLSRHSFDALNADATVARKQFANCASSTVQGQRLVRTLVHTYAAAGAGFCGDYCPAFHQLDRIVRADIDAGTASRALLHVNANDRCVYFSLSFQFPNPLLHLLHLLPHQFDMSFECDFRLIPAGRLHPLHYRGGSGARARCLGRRCRPQHLPNHVQDRSAVPAILFHTATILPASAPPPSFPAPSPTSTPASSSSAG